MLIKESKQKSTRKSLPVLITIPVPLLEQLDEYAEKFFHTRSSLIREAVIKFMEFNSNKRKENANDK